jgi:beta-N-acetylhexosaminidase
MDTLRKLAGRLVLGRLPAFELDQTYRQALQNGTLGGITLFKENARDIEQLAKLTSDILNASYHPPVLTVDQEGGAVQRFDHVLSPLPSPMALAAGGDEQTARQITAISCSQLKALGFNLLLAPTLDLLNNPLNPVICTRAFADKVDLVSTLGAVVIDEIQAQGLAACAKHFPGHGSTDQDSHLELAVVPKTKEQLDAYDLAPFRATIKTVQAVLVGHIWLPELVKDSRPATLSKLVVTDILRGELGFDGLIISDDMTMKAITRAYGLGEACIMALEAGIDLLLVCGSFAESQEAVEAIARSIETGRLSQERIEQSIARLDKLFARRPEPIFCSQEKQAGPELEGAKSDRGKFDRERRDREKLSKLQQKISADTAVSTACSARCAAVLAGFDQPMMLPENILIVAPNHPRYKLPLAAQLSELTGRAIEELRYEVNLSAGEADQIINKAQDRPILLLTFRAFINSGQGNLIKALAQSGRQLIHVACDTPYDVNILLTSLPDSPKSAEIISLASFDPSDQAMAGIARVLTGAASASGKNPLQ